MDKLKKDITGIVDQYLCHSCGSCFAACGHDCIEYKNTVGGFLFPEIDYDKCTNCELCYDVCPGDHFTDALKNQTGEDPFVGDIISTYVGKATDSIIYKNSQSGGVVTALLKYLLETKKISAAIVTSMDTSSPSYSEARIVKTVEELILAQKSKYVPTNITSLMPQIEKIDGNIAMVGLSCHIHGLENLLTIKKKLKGRIIKIGLICDRVMSSTSIDFFSQQITDQKINNFVFRDTSHSSYPGDITVTKNDGSIKTLDKKNRMIMKDYFTPARCLLCFDKMNIYADIVVGDPHGIDNVDRKNGESLVLIRSELGNEIVSHSLKSKSISVKVTSLDKAIAGQGIEMKKKKWNIHYIAWKELGYDLPDYPSSVMANSIEGSRADINKAKKSLMHALSLDDYASKEELLKEANKYHKRIILKEKMFFPVNIIKRVIKKIKREMKNDNRN